MRANVPRVTEPSPLPERIRTAPPIVDPGRAARTRERLPDCAGWESAVRFLDGVFAAAPYLGRLAVQRADTFTRLGRDAPEALVDAAVNAALAAGACEDEAVAMSTLRAAKADLHLSLALADLAGAFSLSEVTGAMTRFADAACQAAFEFAARAAGLPPAASGAFVLALGKHGAGVLNYSSDIDPVIFFEPGAAPDLPGDPRRVYLKLAQAFVRLLQEPTAEGYVFRVDLRLRPDPGSTPPAMSAEAARRYFESRGQTWERAAYAKARWCAGDRALADAFVGDLRPFIWRRTLDFAAVEDVRALARQIQAVGDRADLVSAGHDLKLGRGGIREIEFYAQVVQLVFGGRRSELRVADTRAALRALAQAGLAPAEDVDALIESYEFLRALEHRIQMREDEQSQTLPRDTEARRAVAALAGYADLDAFDAAVVGVLKRVHGVFSAQFEAEESLASHQGSLVLSGVEPTPDTLDTLSRLGFSDPRDVWAKLADWASGRTRALRTHRAQRLFQAVAPRLIEGLAATGDPDGAFRRFAAFLEALPAGVQLLSLLANEPRLADELTALIGAAPRLAEALARRPALLDVMLQPEFARPLRRDDAGWMRARLQSPAADFEEALNAARRAAGEERLRIGAQTLAGRATPAEAGQAYTALGEAAVELMAQAAAGETSRRQGPPAGRWAVLGLGKLGGGELTATSDLDLMTVFEVSQPEADAPGKWFARFTQRLVSALASPTEAGVLFEADMALRPSGASGPIAVSLSRFDAYYAGEAWTWERMALTRARPIAGDAGLCAALEERLDAIAASAGDPGMILADARAMRDRLDREKPPRSVFDVKYMPGGLIDIEFVAQARQLVLRRRLSANTGEALAALAAQGALSDGAARRLGDAWRFYGDLLQMLRITLGEDEDPRVAGDRGARLILRAVGASDLDDLEQRLKSKARAVRQVMEEVLAQV
jgi:glutamate-ammonia-ligase adenylyltransferase